jgi:hypothetical protein
MLPPTELGYFEGGPQGTSFHCLSGYVAVKHPFFGTGTFAIRFCHSLRAFCSRAARRDFVDAFPDAFVD